MMRKFFEIDDDVDQQESVENYAINLTNVEDGKDVTDYFFEYGNEVSEDFYDVEDAVIVEETEVLEMVNVKSKTKREELLESLSYLKSKINKTKQDRESIYTLEMILKNLK